MARGRRRVLARAAARRGAHRARGRATRSASTRDVVPEGFDVRTMVHEYGGRRLRRARRHGLASRHPDGRLYRIDPGRRPRRRSRPTWAARAWRFADGRVTADGRWWIGVRERHDLGEGPAAVVNELVALPTDGSAEPRVLVGGRDFYARPADLARRAPALVPRLGPAVDAVGRDRALGRGARRPTPDGGEHADGRGRRVPGRVDLAARVEPGRRPRVRERPVGLVEPRAAPRRRADGAPRGRGRVRLPAVGVRRPVVRRSSATGGSPAATSATAGRAFAVLDPATGELLDLDLPHDALRWGPAIVAEGSVDRADRRRRGPAEPGRVARLRRAVGRGAARERRRSRSTPRTCPVPRAFELPDRGWADARTPSSTRR